MGGAGFGSQQPVKSHFYDFVGNLLLCESAIVLEPTRKPINHSQEAKGCHGCIHILQHAFRLELVQDFTQTIEMCSLTARDFSILSRRERRDLVNEDGDSSVTSRH
jgi:hypothetical protein